MIMRQLPTSSSSSSSNHVPPFAVQSFLPCPIIIKRYKTGGSREKQEGEIVDDHVRAPSVADEFKRLEVEKKHCKGDDDEEDGIASQTVDKTIDALCEEEAETETDLESVKTRYKEHEPGVDYRRTGTN
ncbi:hypothetical protein LINPERHAP2_LOCUS17111 [Linum perenne]